MVHSLGMFIRIKKSSTRKSTAVQIVDGYRDPTTGKVKQRVIRHIGYAETETDLKRLKELGEHIKAEIIEQKQPGFFSPESMAQMALEGKKKREEKPEDYTVDDMRKLREEQRNITGIHEIYGKQFDALGFDKILANPARKAHSQKIIRDIVLARIAMPQSKRESVKSLEEHFGIRLNLDSVYNAMDFIDDGAIEKIQKRSLAMAQKLFKDKIDVLFYDVTTLYFESFTEDELKSKGFSKDNKFAEVQVMLSIFVTQQGIPIGYDLFPGSTYEGHTLIKSLENLKKRFQVGNVVFVADSGMLNEENLKLLEAHGYQYIVGARLKNMGAAISKQILSAEGYSPLSGGDEGMRGKVFSLKNKRSLVVSRSEKRARKNAHDRQEAIRKLKKKLQKSTQVKSMLSNSGYKKYLDLKGESQIQVNQSKIEEDSQWDGLHGVVTNMKTIDMAQVISHYRGLWQVEETFRVSKHDLKVRPIYHWTQDRIKAHIALCFMALVCVRHLEYRINLTAEKMSPERIRKALLSVGVTTVRHMEDKRLFAIPFNASDDAKKIYKTFGLNLSQTPYLI
jgi:transposase